MVDTAIAVEDISKRFRLHHEKYTSLKERVIHAGRIPYTDLWALRNVSFEVAEGETVGILGQNGSGKSTLLKCICGVLQPTSGQAVVRGKLAGLLELGAGFQQELSGRDNIYLNGSLLGMSRREVDKVFDDVVAFAELEQFIDNQVKFYSSGMYVRLGFAVAVNVDPDILVIDEVLAVGDERFQRKCMERIKLFQEEGRTIVFVSHSPDQVRSICDRAVALHSGEMIGLGAPGEVIRIYRERLLEVGEAIAAETADPDPPSGTAGFAPALSSATVPLAPDVARPIRLTEVTTRYPGAESRPYLATGDPLTVSVGYDASSPIEEVEFVVEIRDAIGGVIVRTDANTAATRMNLPPGRGTVEVTYDSIPFLDGVYKIFAGILSRRGGVLYDWREPAVEFEIMNPGKAVGALVLTAHVELRAGPGQSTGALASAVSLTRPSQAAGA